jgi:hypothetical protein
MRYHPSKEPPEALEQEALFQWAAVASIHHPELALLHAIPNGGHRHKATARALQRQGVKVGEVLLRYLDGHGHG